MELARAAVIGLGVVAVAAGVWTGLRAPEVVPAAVEAIAGNPVAASPIDEDRSQVALVHVSGAVVDPGLVEIDAGDRVADAIAAAGGVLPTADLAAINLAGPVGDGQQIVVPAAGSVGSAGAGGSGAPDDGLVHLNTASAAELERLPGVGEVLALRIVAYRDDNGPFSAVEDLLDVPGIGEAKLAGLRDMAAVP